MNARRISIRRGDLVCIRNGNGATVAVGRGTAWLTQDGDRRDVVLEAGGSFRLDRSGVAVVAAFTASRAHRHRRSGRESAGDRHLAARPAPLRGRRAPRLRILTDHRRSTTWNSATPTCSCTSPARSSAPRSARSCATSRASPGVAGVRPGAKLPKLLLVDYDPAVVAAQSLVALARRRWTAAQLVGM